jgi:CrcB protein
MIVAGLLVGGAAGACLRHFVDRLVQDRHRRNFPLGTLVINVSGSFLLGFLAGWAEHHGVSASWQTFGGTGITGAFTTFSTFSYDTVALAESGRWATAGRNVAFSLVFSLAGVALGLALGIHL